MNKVGGETFFPFKTKPYFDVSVLSLSTHNRPSLRGPVSLSLSPQLPSVACGAVLHVRRAMNMVCYTLIFSLSTHAWLSLSLPLSLSTYTYICMNVYLLKGTVYRWIEYCASLNLMYHSVCLLTYLPSCECLIYLHMWWYFDVRSTKKFEAKYFCALKTCY